jgi:hypothetical protein
MTTFVFPTLKLPLFRNDCDYNGFCSINESILRATEKFVVGTTDQTLTLNITVANQGEDSYQTQYYVTIPPGFEYGGIENYETKVRFTICVIATKVNLINVSSNRLSVHRPNKARAKTGNPTFLFATLETLWQQINGLRSASR